MSISIERNLIGKFNTRYDDNTKGLIVSIDKEVDQAIVDTNKLILQYNLIDATGEWLDEWGSWLGVVRKLSEPDIIYRTRIISTVVNSKNTIPAIKTTVLSYLNSEYGNVFTLDDIIVYETYTNKVCRSSETKRDNPDYTTDNYWKPFIIDIHIPANATSELQDAVNNVKAAGIGVFYTVSTKEPSFGTIDAQNFNISQTEVLQQFFIQEDNPVLNNSGITLWGNTYYGVMFASMRIRLNPSTPMFKIVGFKDYTALQLDELGYEDTYPDSVRTLK